MLRSASLHLASTEIVLVGRDEDAPVVVIDRETASVKAAGKEKVPPLAGTRFEAVFGIVSLLVGKYLIVCTKSETVGSLAEHKIKQMTDFDIIPLTLTAAAHADEEQYLKLLRAALAEPAFYFCISHDISRSLQHASVHDNPTASEIVESTDKRFWWNSHLQQAFVDAKLFRWTVPFVKGFFRIVSGCRVGGRTFTFALLSRRSRFRAGTRYNVRGADAQGDVANEVETEQLVIADDGVTTSLVLLRGSIPLRWTQRANIKYKPKPTLVGDIVLMKAAFRRHFERIIAHYAGSVVAVNLIDQKGAEKELGDAFEALSGQLAKDMPLRYVAFDFHKECKKMRYDRLDNLLAQVKDDMAKHGFTKRFQHGSILNKQQGVVRVNCIDNLDRTNVVQGLFAKHSLALQLQQLGYLGASEQLDDFAEFESTRKNVWADNADAISKQYSGTGALKVDFTRTGKRTTRGLLADGVNSATRYYLNNFCDGERQDAYDLLLAQFVPDKRQISPFTPTETRQLLPMYMTFLTIGIAMLLATAYRPVEPAGYLLRLFVLAVWFLLVLASWRSLVRYGPALVNKPRLVAAHTK